MIENFELDWLKKWNQYAPQLVALKDGDTNKEYTYHQLYKTSCIGAEYLTNIGIKKGDRVVVISLNELDYISLFFAVQRIGAVLVPINYRLTSPEVSHIINDCKPALIVYQPAFNEIIQNVLGYHPIQNILLSDFTAAIHSSDYKHIEFASNPHDPTMIIYTSGTTGAPKGAILSFEMLFWNSINTTLRLNIVQGDAAVIFLPLFHTGGWNVLTTPFLHRGGKIVLVKKFDPDQVLALCESEKATILFGVPTTMDMLYRSKRFNNTDLSTIRYAIVGGEPMPIELIRAWHNKKIPIRQGYGLTEFGPNVFSLNEQDAISKIGSIGFPNFYTEVKVLNDQNQICKSNEVGELCLRGPMCMTGYWNNEKATNETIVDGWLKTGDLVKFDEDGYFYVVGRKKDMYKSGGENVYPPELEKVIRSLNGIREVAVLGVPDIKWGEVGKAFVVLESDSVLQEKDILTHCQKNLAKFKIPKYFKFVPELPKGDSGKILKRQLLEIYKD